MISAFCFSHFGCLTILIFLQYSYYDLPLFLIIHACHNGDTVIAEIIQHPRFIWFDNEILCNCVGLLCSLLIIINQIHFHPDLDIFHLVKYLCMPKIDDRTKKHAVECFYALTPKFFILKPQMTFCLFSLKRGFEREFFHFYEILDQIWREISEYCSFLLRKTFTKFLAVSCQLCRVDWESLLSIGSAFLFSPIHL